MATAANSNPYETNLDKNAANYVALSPLSYMERAASVYPDQLAVVYGAVRRNWAETYARCRRFASALSKRGIGIGDTVSIMATNTPELFEAHYGIPMAGAVLNAINTRLDAASIKFILEHAEAKVLITDREFSKVVKPALAEMANPPLVIDIDDPSYEGGELVGELDYEAFLAEGDPEFVWALPEDEWRSIALNYTSGTTGNPKGVVYSHRGAYLNAIDNILRWGMPLKPTYLWTLPMFHCNGWCFPWTLAINAGTSVCLRSVRLENIMELIKSEKVSHFCGAPIILNMIVNAPDEMKTGIDHKLEVMTAGAAPPAAIIEGMERMGVQVTHVYGLTEVYGPTIFCAWHEKWDDLPIEDKARIKARQGVRGPIMEGAMVADPIDMTPMPKDGESMGEIFMRGNNVMKGYLKNPGATEESFRGGWFHTGDLAVWHEDGYIEIKDRSKDIIISGGENISSLEVEDVLYRHPAILEAAVVARPDPKWGETPCAFVTVKPNAKVSKDEVIAWCREHLAHYKVPKNIVFGSLPKTSTGKIQKFELRKAAKELGQ